MTTAWTGFLWRAAVKKKNVQKPEYNYQEIWYFLPGNGCFSRLQQPTKFKRNHVIGGRLMTGYATQPEAVIGHCLPACPRAGPASHKAANDQRAGHRLHPGCFVWAQRWRRILAFCPTPSQQTHMSREPRTRRWCTGPSSPLPPLSHRSCRPWSCAPRKGSPCKQSAGEKGGKTIRDVVVGGWGVVSRWEAAQVINERLRRSSDWCVSHRWQASMQISMTSPHYRHGDLHAAH